LGREQREDREEERAGEVAGGGPAVAAVGQLLRGGHEFDAAEQVAELRPVGVVPGREDELPRVGADGVVAGREAAGRDGVRRGKTAVFSPPGSGSRNRSSAGCRNSATFGRGAASGSSSPAGSSSRAGSQPRPCRQPSRFQSAGSARSPNAASTPPPACTNRS